VDIITHAIIGAIIADLALWNRPLKERNRGRLIGAVLAAIPDLGGLPGQIAFSLAAGDWPWVFDILHWEGVENSWLLAGYWVSHSILLPVIAWIFLRRRGWAGWMFLAWASHGFVDVLTHTGPWSIWLFYPLPGQIEGLADPWSWGMKGWLFCIIIATLLWYFTSLVAEYWRTNPLEPAQT